MKTCCNCTGTPIIRGGSDASSVRTDAEYRVVSLRKRTIISRMTSFHINQLVLRSTLLEEQANPADDFSRTDCVFSHSGRGFTSLFHITMIARKPAQAGVDVGDGGGTASSARITSEARRFTVVA